MSYGSIEVVVDGAGYPVELAPGFDGLARALGAVLRPGRVVVVSNDVVAPLHAEAARAALVGAGWDVIRIDIPDGESQKTLATWATLVSRILDVQPDRGTPVVALGGGVTGDLVGFAAASVLRGLPFVQVPTTLLAMVDASVGGKVGVNSAQGKNLVGAFWQPRLVYAPFSALGTLPMEELRCGLGEVLKHAVLAGEDALRELEADQGALRARDPAALARAVRASVACKAAVVAADPRESGVRATLNLGHTLGHAVEQVAGFGRVRHGEAVAIGLVAISRFAERRGWAEPGLVRRVADLCGGLGLPVRCGDDLDRDALVRAVTFDKKRDRATITLVVPSAPGRVALRPLPLGEVPELVDSLFDSPSGPPPPTRSEA